MRSTEATKPAPRLAPLHVEEHDDEEEEGHDRARVDEDEDERQEVGVEQDEEARDRRQAEKEAHGPVDGVLAQDDPEGEAQGEDGEAAEGEVLHRLGCAPQACPPPSLAAFSAFFFTSHLKCLSGSVPPSS